MWLKARFYLSKRANSTADQMKELRDQLCKFTVISLPPPSPATRPVPLGTPIEFESRTSIQEEIMKTLRSVDVNMIGICGMGGVGKTTMVKKIMNRALEENVFDEIVMVIFSQQVNNVRIQVEIARSLGLDLEKESPHSRAQKLHAILSSPKRILLVLDDVWRSIVLEDLGIPCASGCKILVTSRNRDVLSAMSIQKICGVQILSPIEAWFLFREKAGICVDAIELKSIAENVVKECRGLPIALTTVGVALKDENSLSIWKDSLGQLTKANPLDIPNVIAEVYNPLKLSYDFLESNHQKSVFLLCCLYPEDCDIPLERLTYISMGLRMFEEMQELEEVRNRMCQLIKTLKNRFLLLDGRDEYHVRMHDVIRDVSTSIAQKKGLINCNDCQWFSSDVEGRPRLHVETFSPNLHLVILNNGVELEFQIDDRFIERTRELNVFFFRRSMLRSLPPNTHLLKNLVTLAIYECDSLETLEHVGGLVNLEILICHGCKLLAEVPVELRGLKPLRLLDISRCKNLKRVAPGVISSLVALEELILMQSFNKWEAEVEGKERENAGYKELEALTNLRCLEIGVLDYRLASVQLCLSPKLVKFKVRFGPASSWLFVNRICKKLLELAYEDNSWGYLPTDPFLRSTEHLEASGNHWTFNMDLANAQNIRSLSLSFFDNFKNLTTASIDWRSGAAVFPLLEYLSLEYIDSLEEMWDGPIPSNSFKSLKHLLLVNLPGLKQLWRGSPNHNNVVPIFTNLSDIHISNCHALGHVFSSAEAKVLQLERLEIRNCGVMEHVLVHNVEDKETTELEEGSQISTIFPKLKTLSIYRLPKLMSICKGIESIEFPLLTQLIIQDCPNMNCLVSTAPSDNHNSDHYHDLDSTHLFCKPKVTFSNLKTLTVWKVNNKNAWCDGVPIAFFRGLETLKIESSSNIRSLLSSSIADNLVNLQRLIMSDCPRMVKVIEDKEEEEDMLNGRKKRLFPRLQELRLRKLPELRSFCEWRCDVELPSLKVLDFSGCSKFRSFSAGSVFIPALKTIQADDQEFEFVEGINAVLQQLSAEAPERERKAKEDWEERRRKAREEMEILERKRKAKEETEESDPKGERRGVHKRKQQKTGTEFQRN